MVDTSTFDKTIVKREAEMAEHQRRLAEIYERFRDATVTWARGSYASDIEQAIGKHPEQVRDLGLERLGILKQNLSQLDASAKDIVDEEFRRVGWGHDSTLRLDEEPYSSNPFRTYRNQAPNYLDDALRRIRGQAGPALVEAGLAEREWRGTRYPFAYDWSQDMAEAMASYANVFDQLLKTAKDRREAELAKAKAEADDLWRKA